MFKKDLEFNGTNSMITLESTKVSNEVQKQPEKREKSIQLVVAVGSALA
jgi:hypothetical protein